MSNDVSSDRVIHFFEYLKYEDLDELTNNLEFTQPIKNEKGIYLTTITEPISFYLPKSDIEGIYQDDHERQIVRYRVDLDTHCEILEFIDNLDSLTVNFASLNSKKWFGKEIETKVLFTKLDTVTVYNDTENIFIDINLENLNLIDMINLYNNDVNKQLLVKIKGIEFYKNKFKLSLVLENIIDIIFEEGNENESLNFSNMLETNNSHNEDNTINDLMIVNNDEDNDIIDNNKTIYKDISNNCNIENNICSDSKINTEIINDLAEKLEDLSNNQDNTSTECLPDTVLNELENEITQKKLEKQKFLINAERAKRAFDNLSEKARDTESEIQELNEKIIQSHKTINSLSNI